MERRWQPRSCPPSQQATASVAPRPSCIDTPLCRRPLDVWGVHAAGSWGSKLPRAGRLAWCPPCGGHRSKPHRAAANHAPGGASSCPAVVTSTPQHARIMVGRRANTQRRNRTTDTEQRRTQYRVASTRHSALRRVRPPHTTARRKCVRAPTPPPTMLMRVVACRRSTLPLEQSCADPCRPPPAALHTTQWHAGGRRRGHTRNTIIA